MSLFQLGRTVMTQGVNCDVDQTDVMAAITRHLSGDWGDVCAEDKKANDEAVKVGDRILSSYEDSKGTKFWIITEYDRSVTTVLLPSEY